jgi:hypothetical protein
MTADTLTKLLLGNLGTLVGLLLIVASGKRGDWMFRGAHEQVIAGKDAVIAEVRKQLAEEQQRSDRYEAMALRLLHATEEATQVAREAVKRGAP